MRAGGFWGTQQGATNTSSTGKREYHQAQDVHAAIHLVDGATTSNNHTGRCLPSAHRHCSCVMLAAAVSPYTDMQTSQQSIRRLC
jgi:hypothetical protein